MGVWLRNLDTELEIKGSYRLKDELISRLCGRLRLYRRNSRATLRHIAKRHRTRGITLAAMHTRCHAKGSPTTPLGTLGNPKPPLGTHGNETYSSMHATSMYDPICLADQG